MALTATADSCACGVGSTSSSDAIDNAVQIYLWRTLVHSFGNNYRLYGRSNPARVLCTYLRNHVLVACLSLLRQRFDELAHQIDDRPVVLPCLVIMLKVKRFCGGNKDHIELIQQDNELSAMSPCQIEMMLTNPGDHHW